MEVDQNQWVFEKVTPCDTKLCSWTHKKEGKNALISSIKSAMSFETWIFFFGLNREAPYTFNFFWYSWFPDISCTDISGFCRLFSPCLSSMGAIGPNLEFDLEWPPSWYVFPIRPVWRITFPKFEPSWSKLKFDTTFDLLLDLFFQLTPCGGSLSPRLRPIGASWNLMRPLTPIDLQCDTKNL